MAFCVGVVFRSFANAVTEVELAGSGIVAFVYEWQESWVVGGGVSASCIRWDCLETHFKILRETVTFFLPAESYNLRLKYFEVVKLGWVEAKGLWM